MAVATFAAGCFWGVEAAFRAVPGVISTGVGYTGGSLADPSYEQVCGGRTGHVEAVRIEFDPKQVSYEELLHMFWSIHDPTTLNRQGPDTGPQYRSAIFVTSPVHEQAAHASLSAQNDSGRFGKPIVTEICPAGEFYRAEDYHQQYFDKQGRARFL